MLHLYFGSYLNLFSIFIGAGINKSEIILCFYGIMSSMAFLPYTGHRIEFFCDGSFPIKLEKFTVTQKIFSLQVSFEKWAAMPFSWITTVICSLPDHTYKDIFPSNLDRGVFITLLVIQLMHILGVFDLFSYLARYICRVPQNNL